MSNEELALAYQAGDRPALHALWIQVEKKLARRMVKRYIGLARRNRAIDFDDLLQSAFLAVERAASAFREDEGSFVSVMDFYVKSEASALLGLRGRVRQEHYEAVSTSTPLGEEGDVTLLDVLEDTGLPDQDESLLRDDVVREVRAAIDRLKPVTEAEAVRCYYLEGARLSVLAAQMGVSTSRAGQIKSSAIRHLRRDRRLYALLDEDDALCYRHKGVTAFQRDWTSVTEAAALWRM